MHIQETYFLTAIWRKVSDSHVCTIYTNVGCVLSTQYAPYFDFMQIMIGLCIYSYIPPLR